MSRLVTGVIDEARDRSTAFDPKSQPPGPVYRFLAAYCQELQGKILTIDPAYSGFETTLTYQLPLADHDAGLALGPNRLVSEIIYADPSSVAEPGTLPITLISRDQRHAPNVPHRFAWQEGDILYLRGPASRWTGLVGTIQVRVTQPFADATITALQAPLAVLPLPDTCALAAVEAVAAFMGRRADPPMDLSGVAATAEANALASIMSRMAGTVVFTQDVWEP